MPTLISALLLFNLSIALSDPSPQNWPAFRGADASGTVAGATPPSTRGATCSSSER
jgi:hypothetical protein